MTDSTTEEAVITVTIRDDGSDWNVKFELESGSQRLLAALAAIVSGSDALADAAEGN